MSGMKSCSWCSGILIRAQASKRRDDARSRYEYCIVGVVVTEMLRQTVQSWVFVLHQWLSDGSLFRIGKCTVIQALQIRDASKPDKMFMSTKQQ